MKKGPVLFLIDRDEAKAKASVIVPLTYFSFHIEIFCCVVPLHKILFDYFYIDNSAGAKEVIFRRRVVIDICIVVR